MLLGAAGCLVLAFAALAHLGHEVARGDLLPFFDGYQVRQVDVLGANVYVDVSTDAWDASSAALLVAAAALLGVAGERAGAAGLLFFAADDLLAAHETVGHNLGALAGLPLVDHPDDVIVAVYGAVICGWLWRRRRLLAAVPRARPGVALTVLAGGAAVVHDVLPFDARTAEEGLEVVAAAGILLGAGALAQAVRRSAEQRSAGQTTPLANRRP